MSDIHDLSPLWKKWEIGEKLGSGSFGTVWEARSIDEGNPESSAIKDVSFFFTPEELKRTAKIEGFTEEGVKQYFGGVLDQMEKEVEIMHELSAYRPIVHFYESERLPINPEKGFGWRLLIRMEQLVPFRKYQTENELSLDDVARLGIDLCQALEGLKDLGIVHRDIKPENIFYKPQGNEFRLGDFGISQYLDRPTAGKGKAGTISHMSPQVYAGRSFDFADDLYAVAIILYRILNNNRVPCLPHFPENFTPEMRDEALIRRLRGEPVGLPYASVVSESDRENVFLNIPQDQWPLAYEFGKILVKALDPEVENRYSGPKELREAIEGLFSHLEKRSKYLEDSSSKQDQTED